MCKFLIFATLVLAVQEERVSRSSQKMAMEVNAGGRADPAPEAAADTKPEDAKAADAKAEAPAASTAATDEKEKAPAPGSCAEKKETCFKRCESMFEYYIMDVNYKFEALDLIVGGDAPSQVSAVQPITSEGAFLFCGVENCFETYCMDVCKEGADKQTGGSLDDEDLNARCKKVETRKLESMDIWFANVPDETQEKVMIPKCKSVCGPNEDTPANQRSGAYAFVGVAVFALLFA